MKLTFEYSLQFQQNVIESITDLFEGQPMEDSILGNIIKFNNERQ